MVTYLQIHKRVGILSKRMGILNKMVSFLKSELDQNSSVSPTIACVPRRSLLTRYPEASATQGWLPVFFLFCANW
jgi:hypothetical protein